MTRAVQSHGHDAVFRGKAKAVDGLRYTWRYETRKLFGDAWVRVGHFQVRDRDQLDRHARAMGGSVRLVRKRDGEVLGEWLEGVRCG